MSARLSHFDADFAWNVDPRFARYRSAATDNCFELSRGYFDDHRHNVAGYRTQVRPPLKKRTKTRRKISMDHLEEFLGYMNSHERYMQVLQEFAEETEEDEPDVGWCWDDLRPWSKLMMPGDPDAMGCILSHYTMYFVFYRWEYQMSLGEEKKHNIAVHSARSHTIPDVYRVLIADNPSWNDGFVDAAPGLRNLKSKCPSWRSFLENLVGWIPGGGFADVERADGVYRPVRENVVRHLPPNAHGIRTATAIGLVHLGGIRPHQACLAKRSAVVESPPRPLAPGEVDDGRPRSRIEVSTRNIKSNFFNLERMIPIEGSGPRGKESRIGVSAQPKVLLIILWVYLTDAFFK